MRMRTLAVTTVVISALLALPAISSPASPTTQPTLTLERNCSAYPPFHTVDVRLTGFPANTPISGSIQFPDGSGVGATFSTDGSGNFEFVGIGSTEPGTNTVTIVWSGGTLVESLNVNCALPASKEECKNGGWQTFGVFKNQGDCVSFVANGGKQSPADEGDTPQPR